MRGIVGRQASDVDGIGACAAVDRQRAGRIVEGNGLTGGGGHGGLAAGRIGDRDRLRRGTVVQRHVRGVDRRGDRFQAGVVYREVDRRVAVEVDLRVTVVRVGEAVNHGVGAAVYQFQRVVAIGAAVDVEGTGKIGRNVDPEGVVLTVGAVDRQGIQGTHRDLQKHNTVAAHDHIAALDHDLSNAAAARQGHAAVGRGAECDDLDEVVFDLAIGGQSGRSQVTGGAQPETGEGVADRRIGRNRERQRIVAAG